MVGIGTILLMAAIGCLQAADYPQADISNGQIRVKLNLPDSQRGYYRGTRFDWSGVIAKLEYNGHTYFEPFYEKFDPNVRDVDLKNGVVAGPISATSGPVDEFGGADGASQTRSTYRSNARPSNVLKFGIFPLNRRVAVRG